MNRDPHDPLNKTGLDNKHLAQVSTEDLLKISANQENIQRPPKLWESRYYADYQPSYNFFYWLIRQDAKDLSNLITECGLYCDEDIIKDYINPSLKTFSDARLANDAMKITWNVIPKQYKQIHLDRHDRKMLFDAMVLIHRTVAIAAFDYICSVKQFYKDKTEQIESLFDAIAQTAPDAIYDHARGTYLRQLWNHQDKQQVKRMRKHAPHYGNDRSTQSILDDIERLRIHQAERLLNYRLGE